MIKVYGAAGILGGLGGPGRYGAGPSGYGGGPGGYGGGPGGYGDGPGNAGGLGGPRLGGTFQEVTHFIPYFLYKFLHLNILRAWLWLWSIKTTKSM